MSKSVERKRCKNCQQFFKPRRKTSEFCSVACSVRYRNFPYTAEDIAKAEKKKEKREKAKMHRRLMRAMDNYWLNYVDGRILGRQAQQVAPLLSYHPFPTVRTLSGGVRLRRLVDVVKSPEDLAWVKDPEGVMLGKYNF